MLLSLGFLSRGLGLLKMSTLAERQDVEVELYSGHPVVATLTGKGLAVHLPVAIGAQLREKFRTGSLHKLLLRGGLLLERLEVGTSLERSSNMVGQNSIRKAFGVEGLERRARADGTSHGGFEFRP